ncbi:family 1 polysaccharide lyase [Melampsora larici-populina 98AG31]|uniref:pectin lyase n=1 Tax=Melampsora larici-populina (strain 98AG31 / pathotype 3-4-7) TaxID=747676 RepID=F4S5N1_MELLP|nr:family 1 polysaccharide lyase [Melampsora larici-populina 98AG31]EGG00056.1 family 1 polysaccharide lyase [Melampsora larici-populina 98AG31]
MELLSKAVDPLALQDSAFHRGGADDVKLTLGKLAVAVFDRAFYSLNPSHIAGTGCRHIIITLRLAGFAGTFVFKTVPRRPSLRYKVFVNWILLDLTRSVRSQVNMDDTHTRQENDPQGNDLPTPFGYGSETTGGGNAKPDTPKSIEELESLLKDDKPRVILIDRTFDFTNTKGNKTEKGCAPWSSCKNGNMVQHARNAGDWCEDSWKQGKETQVTYDAAGIDGLEVKSDKTIRGIGKNGVIKGKGLRMARSSNVIIQLMINHLPIIYRYQNIHITYLNPHLVWGGDAISIDSGKNIWVDHCTFSFIGREMVVVGHDKTTGITLSNNHFDGRTKWSTSCSNQHYWAALLSGDGTTVTMANNTSGRSPKLGVGEMKNVDVHYYNNVHSNCVGSTFEVNGGNILAEGNFFKEVYADHKDQTKTEDGGSAYIPFTSEETQKCKSHIGRDCAPNMMENKKKDTKVGKIKFGKTEKVLEEFKNVKYVQNVTPKAGSELKGKPPGGCGFGLL